jgi:hypothetical protein
MRNDIPFLNLNNILNGLLGGAGALGGNAGGSDDLIDIVL